MIYKAWSTATCLMYILCDIICAWRTVILWNENRRIIAVLGLFILGTIGAAGYALSFRSFGVVGDSFTSLGGMDLIVIVPTLSTNMLSTGLITWKAWQRRILVREHLCEGKGSVRVDRVFALLIESGLIYCCIWIYYWISRSTGLPDPGFTTIALYSGLYPTLIIILISKTFSPVDHYSTQSTGMQYTHVPTFGPPTDGGVPPHVPTTRRDSTSYCDVQIPLRHLWSLLTRKGTSCKLVSFWLLWWKVLSMSPSSSGCTVCHGRREPSILEYLFTINRTSTTSTPVIVDLHKPG